VVVVEALVDLLELLVLVAAAPERTIVVQELLAVLILEAVQAVEVVQVVLV
jgi:hypothetical protein